MPPPDLKLSTFTINGLAPEEIWAIGNKNVAEPQGKMLRGRGDIRITDVRSARLEPDFDDVPERHANIIGWPGEKEQQKMRATILAEAAELCLI